MEAGQERERKHVLLVLERENKEKVSANDGMQLFVHLSKPYCDDVVKAADSPPTSPCEKLHSFNRLSSAAR
jgi:hypothetical protein